MSWSRVLVLCGHPRCRRLAAGLVRIALYAALAVWSTWPLVKSMERSLPLTTMAVTTVPLFNVWTIWWNADRLQHGFRGYWDAPIFFPTQNTFAFSEPETTTILVAPVLWLSGSRVVAYNVWLLASLALNGLFADRFLRACGVRWPAALSGGAAMVLLPLVHWQLEVLQLVPLWGFLWMWTALVRNWRRPSVWRGMEIGLAFGIAFLTCAHQGLFAAFLAPCAIVLLPWRGLFRTLAAWITAALIGAAFVVPIALPMKQAFKDHGFTRKATLVSQLSAMPGDYTVPAGKAWIPGSFGARDFWKLSPGWLKYGFAVPAILFGLWRRKWRRITLFLLLTGLAAFLLSLGPHLDIRGWQPWWSVAKYCPGMSQVRNVFRFGYFAQMAVVLLAGLSLELVGHIGRRWLWRGWRWISCALVLGLGAALTFEVRPEPLKLSPAPDVAPHRGWIEFVRDNTKPAHGLLCLPFGAGDTVESFASTTEWMYYGTYHGRPLVNGYSGFFPADFYDLRGEFTRVFLTEEILVRLAEQKVEYVVIDRRVFRGAALDNAVYGTIRLELAYEDLQTAIDVYQIRVRPSPTFR